LAGGKGKVLYVFIAPLLSIKGGNMQEYDIEKLPKRIKNKFKRKEK